MGLFSGISKALFGDPGKDIRRSADQQLAFQREALDYAKDLDRPLIEARGQALPLLSGFYTGDEAAQQEIVDRAMASPFYSQLIETGQEGVLGRAGQMGLTRSGNVAADLSRVNQNVLQGLVGQQLSGLQALSSPQLSTSGITGILQNMGQTAGQSGIAQARANQSGIGNLLGGTLGVLGLPGVLGGE